MTKTKKFVTRILPVIAVLAILVTSVALLTACKSDNFVPLDTSSLELFDYRIGYIAGDSANNTVDLSKAIPGGSNFDVDDDKYASVSGTTMTALAAGTTEMTYSIENSAGELVEKTVNLHVLNGYTNVDTWDEFYAASMVDADEANVVIQAELTAVKGKNFYFASSTVHPDVLNVYGNVLTADVSPITEDGTHVFNIDTVQVTLNVNDMHLYGAHPSEEDVAAGTINLVDFEGYGFFFYSRGNDSVFPVLNITHCLTENSQKHAYVISSEVNMTGSIMRNGADALLAAETSNTKGAVLNIENSVFANSVVCGIILCGWTPVTGPEDFCTLNLEGFVDFYNWKNRETTQLMPNTEDWAAIVNPVVKGEIQAEKNDAFFVKQSDDAPMAEQYLNVCIIRISSGGQPNDSAINGLEPLDLMMDTFPLPSIANGILKSCHVITNYQDSVSWTSKLSNNPKSTMSMNANLNYELVHGREA